MKIKTLLLTTTLLVSTAAFADASVSAPKQNDNMFKNFYAKIEAGITMPSQLKFTDEGTKGKIKLKKGFVGGIGAGYRFNEFLRSDLMLQYRQAGIKKINGDKEYGKIKAHSVGLMLNGYLDAHNDTMFTPYAMAGVGVSRNTMSFKSDDENDIMKAKINFAWNAGVGVQAKVYEKISLDLGYRYVALGKPCKFAKSANKKVKNLNAHEVLLGLVYDL